MAATNANADNYFSPSRWVVSSVSGQGSHSTITAATAAASSGDTIVLMDYVATEDVAMKTGVNYTAFTNASNEPTSTVTGKWTYAGAGTVSISNIKMTTNSDNLLAITGSAASVVILTNCYLNCSTTTGISFTTTNTAATISINSCGGNLGTTGIGFHSMSSTGAISYIYCILGNGGGSSTISNNSAGVSFYNFCEFSSPIGSSSTGAIDGSYITVNSTAQNATALTANGTGISGFSYSQFESGSASAVTIGVGASIELETCGFGSSNTNAVTGAGSLTVIQPSFISSSFLMNTTTILGGTQQGLRNGSNPNAGYIGEQIRSLAGPVTFTSSANPFNITSISLTPGIWDVSGIAQLVASVAGTAYNLYISVNSASFTGAVTGDNLSQGGFTFTTIGVAIPSFRIILSSTTTYYLVGGITYASGTNTGTGRISATRVG